MKKRILLFDVDGTLTVPQFPIKQDMKEILQKLNQKYILAIIGGSLLKKIQQQIGKPFIKIFKFVFSQNGLYVIRDGQVFHNRSIKDELGEQNLSLFIKTVLKYLSELYIPKMRGTFIEYRNGMINISPIGRNCSKQERDEFEIYDKNEKIREKMIRYLKEKLPDFKLKYSIGGQISFDVFPIGWDKSYCLKFLQEYQQIYFFGDKTYQGGNDYQIFTHQRTIGYSIKNPSQLISVLKQNFINV